MLRLFLTLNLLGRRLSGYSWGHALGTQPILKTKAMKVVAASSMASLWRALRRGAVSQPELGVSQFLLYQKEFSTTFFG